MSLNKRLIRENIKKAGDPGSTGVQGPAGPAGPSGADGASWSSGEGAPVASYGSVGDFWLDSLTGEFYVKTGSLAWVKQGSIRGPQGEQGLQGPAFYNADGGHPFSVYGGTEPLDGGGI